MMIYYSKVKKDRPELDGLSNMDGRLNQFLVIVQ